jgi:hypothetical protein
VRDIPTSHASATLVFLIFFFTAFLAKKFGPQVVFLFFLQVRRTNEGVETNLPCVSFYQSDMHSACKFLCLFTQFKFRLCFVCERENLCFHERSFVSISPFLGKL